MSGLDRIESRFDEARLMRLVERAMRRAVHFGATVMRDNIESRGTDKEWKGTWRGRDSSGRGRVESGDMLKDVDGDIIESTRKRIVAAMGWIDGSEPYYLFQEYGFRHWITGELIEGMQALRDADEETWEEMIVEIDKAVREFARG